MNKTIDFVISNDRHHVDMFLPIVEILSQQPNVQVRVLSLCEFRGLPSPTERFDMPNTQFLQLVPRLRPSSSSGKQSGSSHSKWLRQAARRAAWYGLLYLPIRQVLQKKSALVVLANDAAFPYDRITRQLHDRQIPFLLVQEGIRFYVPAGGDFDQYGKMGATAVAAWGETSAAFFRQQGVPDTHIYRVGNPRFDVIARTDWNTAAENLRHQHRLGQHNLLFLSNPIDDQGFCTTEEKVALIRRFVVEIGSLFADPEFCLIIKLHGRESEAEIHNSLADMPFSPQIVVSNTMPLYPLFALGQAAIIFASTVGLEALMFDLPLGVLEIPDHGFAYDYVEQGAAQGLCWSRPMAAQVQSLIKTSPETKAKAQAYLENSLAVRENATGQIVDLILDLIR